MIKRLPPYFYQCHHCGAHFYLKHEALVIINPFRALVSLPIKLKGNTIGPKCQNCGSRNTAKNNYIKK
jgi:DNA-directed RNA polymerase subunit RPC12/RpoP